MTDNHKTKKQLIQELAELREYINQLNKQPPQANNFQARLEKEITARKQAEASLKQSQERAQKAELHAEQQKHLIEASQAMLSVVTPDEVVLQLLKTMHKLIPFDIYGLYRLDEEQAVLQPWNTVQDDQIFDLMSEWPISLGQGITSAVALSGQSELINNSHSDPRSIYPTETTVEQEHLVSVPIKIKGNTVGVFNIGRINGTPFTAEEFDLVNLFIMQTASALHNAQLYNQVNQRAVELSTMLTAAKTISSTLDLEEVLTVIARLLVEATEVSSCTLSRWDKETNSVITWVNWYAEDIEVMDEVDAVYDLDQYPSTQWVLEQVQPLTILASDTATHAAEVTLMEPYAVLSLLMLPLTVGNKTIGLAELAETTSERSFTSSELHLCQALTHQAAIAIENAQLYAKTQKQLRDQTALYEAGLLITSSLDLEVILSKITEKTTQIIAIDNCTLSQWVQTKESVVTLATYTSPNLLSPGLGLDEVGTKYSLKDYPATARVFQEQVCLTVYVGDTGADPAEISLLTELGCNGLLMVPMVYKEQTTGLLELRVGAHRNYQFTPDDITLCQGLANQTAIAIENARLYQETQKRLKEQIVLREATTIISSTLELEAVLAHIAEQMGQGVDATSAYICSWEPESKSSKVLAEYFGPEAHTKECESDLGVTYQDNDASFAEMIQRGLPTVKHDTSLKMPLSDKLHLQKYQIKTVLYIPVQIREKTIAYAELWESRYNREFTNEEIALCQDIAQQAAIAMENARLHAGLEQRVQQLAVLHELDRAISTSLNVNEIYYAFANHAKRLLPYDRVSIVQLEDDNLQVVYTSGYQPTTDTTLITQLSSISWVMSKGQPLLRHNIPSNVRFSEDHKLIDRDIQSSMSIPLRVQRKIIGVWNVASQQAGIYSPDDIDIAQSMADQLSLAIENARLYTQAQQEIQERKRAEKIRGELEEQLHQAQKLEAIGQLAGGIAHDFNNILTAIMGYAGFAFETLPPDSPTRSDIQGIQKSAQRAANLTRQMLAFARKQIIEPRVVHFNELIFNMDKMLRRLIREDIELVVLPAPDLGAVKFDPGQFEQILMNLVVNARDAMPNGGKLTIETANIPLTDIYTEQHPEVMAGDYVMLAVTDTGTGISKDIQNRIFEPFFTTKEVGEGTGLGLATCFGIVKQNQGHIWVYSELGLGTTFKVYIPQIEATSVSKRAKSSFFALPRGTETILLVEDETSIRYLAARVLRQQGYTVFEASNGTEALNVRLAQDNTLFDLLVTDIIMPQMGGKELFNQLKADDTDLKVLFISGYSDKSIIQHKVLETGVAFLQKPFLPDTLARKVRKVLDEL